MRGSSVTAARSCLQPLVSASRYLAVHALPGDPLYFVVDVKSKVKEVYAQTCQLLGQQGMQECELFGLATLSDGEYLFVDPESKLSKYAPKNWRSSHTYGLDSSGRPAFVLYFRVRYYVDTPLLLSDVTSRHHYYLQLRDNVVRHGGGCVENWQGDDSPQHPLQTSALVGPWLSLAGLALQAEFGNYTEECNRRQGYCKLSDFLPAHMCEDDSIPSVLAAQHRSNHGMSREVAEMAYIREAVLLDAPLNAHLYRLRRSKSEQGPGRVLLAICTRGVRVYGDDEMDFAWNNIGKLSFDRKKFEIRAVDRPGKLILFSGCDDKSKHLLALCRDTHQFFMAIAPRVSEARMREEEERKAARESFIYPTRSKLSLTTRSSRADQRISLISSTSSNTTSGIVSDRVHSEDEPDAGPASSGSGEDSLANAAASISSTSNSITTITTSSTTTTITTSDGECPIPSPTRPGLTSLILAEVDTASSSCVSGPALGSQCSSSCSTVVVSVASVIGTGSTTAAILSAAAAASGRRRPSASSSLELGYSHTAQNSALSAEAMYDRCNKPVKYAGTDIASETSGVYTLHSSEMLDEPLANDSSVQSTTDEASVTSGFYTIHSGLRSETSGSCYSQGADDEQEPIYSLCQGDDEPVLPPPPPPATKQDNIPNDVMSIVSVNDDDKIMIQSQPNEPDDDDDELRSRSNSILSAGSFRGDGSDPSGQLGPLLSADELSDLIVGRYPPRKNIATSMDSDCDYVRMPPPPAPPPRSDSEMRQLPPPPPYPGLHAAQPPIPKPPPPSYTCPRERFEIPPPTPPRNDAVTPREPPPPPPPPARIQPPTYPGDKMKPTPVHAPVAALVVGPNNYLDVHASRTGPVLLPYLTPPQQAQHQAQQRQPPPPPPHGLSNPGPPNSGSTATASSPMLATVYTSQVARSQIEQYKQQLYSDVDYVMFPLKDPALSKQEYIDAKQGSLLAAMAAYPPPPPYPLQAANKSSLTYRSTPYLAYNSSLSSLSNKYASNQNLAGSLSDTNSSVGGNYLLYGNPSSQYAASTSSLYSGLTCSSGGGGSQSYRKDSGAYASPPPPPLPPPVSARHHPHTSFSRTRSHENILKSYDATSASLSSLALAHGRTSKTCSNIATSLPQTKHRRLPPPPPPPPYDLQTLAPGQSACLGSNDGSRQSENLPAQSQQPDQQQPHHQQQPSQHDLMLDIKTLREKSRNLDLPLISALCNDRYLLKQTKAFVLPKHPSESSSSSNLRNGSSGNSGGSSSSSRHKYPVSGLSTTQISKPPRKTANSTHKHPSSSSSSVASVTTPGTTTTTAAAVTGLSKTLRSQVNAYQVNSTSVDKKNPSRASHS